MGQMDLADICTADHLKTIEYIFFLAVRGTVSKIDHTLGHRENVNKHGKIEVTAFILFYHNDVKLKTNSKRHDREYPTS